MKSYAQVSAIPRTEEYIGTGDGAIYNTVTKMKQIITGSSRNPYVREWAKKIMGRVEVNNKKAEASAIFDFVRDHVRYTKDPLGFEYITTPPVLLEDIRLYTEGRGDRPVGDCVSGDTEVILRNKLTQQYELKNIEDLEFCYSQYEALSYDFEKQDWCFKEIKGWANKGIQQIHKVKFHNGVSEYCTLGHKFFNAKVTGGKLREINFTKLEDIDVCTKDNHIQTSYGRVFCAKRIPNLGNRVNKSNEELWLEGLYIAEGYANDDGSKICIAQDRVDVTKRMDEVMSNVGGICGSWSKRNVHKYFHLSCVHKEQFSKFGYKSINKQVPSEYYSLEEDQIQSLINGYFDGDGEYNNKGVRVYTTVSKKLVNHMSFLHLILGKSLYRCDYGRPLSKYGNYPITRMYEFQSDRGYRREWLNGVSLVGIRSAEYVGNGRVYDIEVEGTHNFVSSSGMIFHNCDDMCVLSLSLLKAIGFHVAIKVVSFTPSKKFGHVYGLVQIGYDWVPFDCVRPDQDMGWESKGHTRVMETII